MSARATPAVRDSTSSISTGRICSICGEGKRLVRSQPDQRYLNLDVIIYACGCGQDAGHFVARKE